MEDDNTLRVAISDARGRPVTSIVRDGRTYNSPTGVYWFLGNATATTPPTTTTRRGVPREHRLPREHRDRDRGNRAVKKKKKKK